MEEVILNLLPLKEEEKAAFEAAAPQAEHIYAGRRTVKEEDLARATVIFGWPKEDRMKDAKRLKWFQSMWAGTDKSTQPGVLPQGVILTNSAGSNSQSVAEHMLAGLLALCRRLPQYRDQQHQGEWKDLGKMKTLTGATVLVVGAGHVGSWFAGLCKALGAGETIGLRRRVQESVPGFDRLAPMEELDALLPQADVVALTLPHTAQTVGLMNRQRLAAMKEDAVLLSAGRGSVLDQQALVELMEGGHLWGAALDVTEPEPLPPDHPLWQVDNLLLTPHVAGGMRLEVTRKNCVNMALENLKRYVAGEPLHNRVQ